ncbi:hypothetical protein [Pleomorphomonas koreensis]|uniref:hypothetical protein n=1 Tax=Pleomorphomonas koreensis TaxID=257440 RepID=UPI0012ECA816|nr:hypothetical protein [Pleomorphomonas koreensis]
MSTCETCAFWQREDPLQSKRKEASRAVFGECRRHAPRLKFERYDGGDRESAWPPTGQGDWCGEFRPTDMKLPLEGPGS